MKILRRGKTGGVFEAGGAGEESRRVTNGGVGTLGGVADRLNVEMGAEASGVEARSGPSVFDFFGGARVFPRTLFFGGTGGAESAASSSIVVGGPVCKFVVTVTISGSRAV